MSYALQLRQADDMQQWQIMREQAETLVKTNFLPQAIKTPEQAIAIMLTGRELGIGTMAALNNINVIAGKPTVSPQLMLALINSSKELEDFSVTDDGKACTVMMKRRGRKPHTEAFSMEDAARMKTTEGYGENKKTISLSEKYNWKQQPATMRKWRAVAACARVVFPDVILGLYTPEELGAAIDGETGEVVEEPKYDIIQPDERAYTLPQNEPAPTVEMAGIPTLAAIERLWPKYGVQVESQSVSFRQYLKQKKGISDPGQMSQADAMAMLEFLQARELAASKPKPDEDAPTTGAEKPKADQGAGLDQWRCTGESGSRKLAMDVLNATKRLEVTGVTEEQWRLELNDVFANYELPVSRKKLSAEDLREQWLPLLVAWAAKREEKK